MNSTITTNVPRNIYLPTLPTFSFQINVREHHTEQSNMDNSEKQHLFVCVFVWWCLEPLITIRQLYSGGQLYWWSKTDNPEKTTEMSQVTDELLSLNVVSSAPRLIGIRTYNDSGDSQIMHYITMSLKLDEETTYH